MIHHLLAAMIWLGVSLAFVWVTAPRVTKREAMILLFMPATFVLMMGWQMTVPGEAGVVDSYRGLIMVGGIWMGAVAGLGLILKGMLRGLEKRWEREDELS